MIINIKKFYTMLTDIRVLTVLSVLVSFNVILSFFSIKLGIVIITFNFIIKSIIGYLYGPFISAFFGGLSDFITFIVRPTGVYNFFFTFTAIVSGFIYGLFFYNKKINLKNIIFASLIQSVVCSLFLNTLGLKIFYSNSILAILPARILKVIILLPIEVILTYIFLNKISKINKKTV